MSFYENINIWDKYIWLPKSGWDRAEVHQKQFSTAAKKFR